MKEPNRRRVSSAKKGKSVGRNGSENMLSQSDESTLKVPMEAALKSSTAGSNKPNGSRVKRQLEAAGQGSTESTDHKDRSIDQVQAIREAAYYNALKRGFTPGQELDDWLEAEKSIRH